MAQEKGDQFFFSQHSLTRLLQASQQPSTPFSNHQTTFLPPFSCCKHSSNYPSHSSAITIMSSTFSPLKSIIFSIKPHQA
ncbi:unnamed protein product [Prunus armeniaca]